MPTKNPSSSGINIIHCAETIKGGIATYLRELIPLQIQEPSIKSITVLVPESQKAELSDLSHEIRIETFKDRSNRLLNAIFIGITSLRLRQENCVFHLHSTFAGLLSRPLLKLFNRKTNIVYCAHGWAWDRSQSSIKKIAIKIIEWILSYLCEKIICISIHDFRTALEAKIIRSKLIIIQNGISVSAPSASPFLMKESTKLKVLFVGRLDYQKGVDIYCAAMLQTADIATGYIVGASVLSDSSQLYIPENVQLMGWMRSDELTAILKKVDLIVIPSRWEGFGLVAIEAMRAGLPVIATQVGGLSEIVENTVTGLLVPPEDVSAISMAIRSVDKSLLKKMGQAGRERFELFFTIDRVHKDILNLYTEINNLHNRSFEH